MQEVIKQQLERKKQDQASNNQNSANWDGSTKKMQSQQTKKASNTRRKMGS
jgi:hypothetical protein